MWFYISALIVYLLVPVLGVIFYKKSIKNGKSPFLENALFIIFLNYGGLLVLTLATIFNMPWSGAASLGVFYLVFAAPVMMAYYSINYRKKRTVSVYHNRIYLAGIFYFAIMPAVLVILYFLS